jgi:hypothetical protein
MAGANPLCSDHLDCSTAAGSIAVARRDGMYAAAADTTASSRKAASIGHGSSVMEGPYQLRSIRNPTAAHGLHVGRRAS